MRAERGSWIVHALAGLWLLGLSLGARAVYHYSTDRGPTGTTPVTWPSASRLQPARTGATAVMFLHPECPCSRASVDELDAALHALPLGARMIVVFEGMGDGSLWASVGDIAPVERVLDDGSEGERFGARTSGYVVAYDARGGLVFRGGITGSRGHVGDNVGRQQFGAALQGTSRGDHPVFGCALISENP